MASAQRPVCVDGVHDCVNALAANSSNTADADGYVNRNRRRLKDSVTNSRRPPSKASLCAVSERLPSLGSSQSTLYARRVSTYSVPSFENRILL